MLIALDVDEVEEKEEEEEEEKAEEEGAKVFDAAAPTVAEPLENMLLLNGNTLPVGELDAEEGEAAEGLLSFSTIRAPAKTL